MKIPSCVTYVTDVSYGIVARLFFFLSLLIMTTWAVINQSMVDAMFGLVCTIAFAILLRDRIIR